MKPLATSRVMGRSVLLFCCACLVSLAVADIPSPDEAALRRLSNDPYWLALLHLHQDGISGYASYVDDPDFFLAKDGAKDPHAELLATMAAFVAQPELQCHFIARRQWLMAQSLHIPWQNQDCEAYRAWRAQLNTVDVVLVFASSYLNSPSSMYGHTFLRFDPPNAQSDSPLLSYALNFGAMVSEEDNGLLYAIRGITGGYLGQFSAQRYYEKVKEYSRFENRDLWEYHLNFSAEEIDRMLAHIWELDLVDFQYYFFDENCSYRLLELLDVARPGHALAHQFPAFAIPIDTVRAVDDAGMIDHVRYRASNGTVQQFFVSQMDDDARSLVKSVVNDSDIVSSPAFQALQPSQQRLTLEVGYDYLREQQKQTGRDADLARRRHALLKALSQLDAPSPGTPPEPTAPDRGHRTSLMAIAVGERDGQAYTDLEARLAYHDLLDNSAGYAAGSSLNMGRIVARLPAHEQPQLEILELVEITSFTPATPLEQPLSWQIRGGAERLYFDDEDALAYQVTGGAGYTRSVWGGLQGFALGRARLEYNPLFDQNLDLAAGAALGLLAQGARNNVFGEVEWLQFAQGADRISVGLGYQWALDRNQGLRINVSRQLNDSKGTYVAGLAYRYYF